MLFLVHTHPSETTVQKMDPISSHCRYQNPNKAAHKATVIQNIQVGFQL